MPRDARQVRWMARGLGLAILVVCSIGLITRLAPDLWPIAANMSQNRLSYPIAYWIALHYGAELTMPEIARLTGEPLSTVQGRVYRGLRKMRKTMHGADSADTP